MRRGFKSEANARAREVRAELSLPRTSPLGVRRLAEHLDIPLIPLSSFHLDAPDASRYFLREGEREFSGVTVFRGHRRAIVFNDAHARGRQASDIAHELAHGMLLHEPATTVDARGLRNWAADLEAEANFLAGALLVPEEAALLVVRKQWSPETAARHFGVTPAMIGYRINVTGARARVQRARGRVPAARS